METRNASDIYEQLKTLRYQLEQLADSGRIVMSRDELNSRHDSQEALAEAFGALDSAIDATCWMETLATVDGEYPVLED
jgi:hypothetical protein